MTVRINYDTNIEDEEIYLFNEKDDKTHTMKRELHIIILMKRKI